MAFSPLKLTISSLKGAISHLLSWSSSVLLAMGCPSCRPCFLLINIGFSASEIWYIWKTNSKWSDTKPIHVGSKAHLEISTGSGGVSVFTVRMGENDIPAPEVGWKSPSPPPNLECHLCLGIHRREFWPGFLKLKPSSIFAPPFSRSENLPLGLASGSSMHGRRALMPLVAWVVASSCSWLPSGPGCWWLRCTQALDAQAWCWPQRWSLKDQQSRKLLSEWSPWKWTPRENWISLWKVCLLVLQK